VKTGILSKLGQFFSGETRAAASPVGHRSTADVQIHATAATKKKPATVAKSPKTAAKVVKVATKPAAKKAVKAPLKTSTKAQPKPAAKPAAKKVTAVKGKAAAPKSAPKTAVKAAKVSKTPAKVAKPTKTATRVAPKVASKVPTKPATKAANKPLAKPVASPVKASTPKPIETPKGAKPAKVIAVSLSPAEAAKTALKPSADAVVTKKLPKSPQVIPTTPLLMTANNPSAIPVKAASPPPPAVRRINPKHPPLPAPAATVLERAYVPVAVAVSSPAPTKTQPIDAALKDVWKKRNPESLRDDELLAMPDAEYMSDLQLGFFKVRLLQMQQDILKHAGETTEHLREDTLTVPDPADRATIEEEHALELRTRDRERKLLKKITQAIALIDSSDYGFCEETGEPIGIRRLLARPTATLSLEAQQRRELKQKLFGD
jgi:DnaK suppressor protein